MRKRADDLSRFTLFSALLLAGCSDKAAAEGPGTEPGQSDATPDGRVSPGSGEASATPATCTPPSSPPAQSLVLFGGFQASPHDRFLGDTWTWNGTAWTQRMVPGPSPRARSAIATLNGTVVLFGGTNEGPQGGGANGETWTWDGACWTQRLVPGPPARSDSAMATLNGTVVLFGGGSENDSVQYDDTWTWDGTSWTQHEVPGPSARFNVMLATLNDNVVLFGGLSGPGAAPGDPPGATSLDDTWTWDGTTWTQQNVPGPPGQYSAAMATLNGTVVMFGGDTWTWDGTSWTPFTLPDSPGSEGPALAPFNGVVVEFGGGGAAGPSDQTWTWNGATWSQLDVGGPGPRMNAMLSGP